jgi:hypothetical protein
VDFGKLNVSDLILLSKAANEFDLPRLAWLLENHVRKTLNLSNIYETLKEAEQLKQTGIKDICIDFILKENHYNQFISNKDGVNVIGVDLFREITVLQASGKAKPLEVKPCPPSTLVRVFFFPFFFLFYPLLVVEKCPIFLCWRKKKID